MSVYINFPSGRISRWFWSPSSTRRTSQPKSLWKLSVYCTDLRHIISPMSSTNDRDIYISNSLLSPLTSEFKHSRLSNHQLLHNTERTNPLRWSHQIRQFHCRRSFSRFTLFISRVSNRFSIYSYPTVKWSKSWICQLPLKTRDLMTKCLWNMFWRARKTCNRRSPD
jgi:hypothetical protein